MNFALFQPVAHSNEALGFDCTEEVFLSAYSLVKGRFSQLSDCRSKAAVQKFVWEHREELESHSVQVLEFFSFCTKGVETCKQIDAETKAEVMKLWTVLYQYTILTGNEPTSFNTLADFLLRLSSEDPQDYLLQFGKLIREIAVADVKDLLEKSGEDSAVAGGLYRDYVLLAILAAASERLNDFSGLKEYLDFFLSQLQEASENERTFELELKGEEKWVACSEKAKVVAEHCGCTKFALCTLRSGNSLRFTLKSAVLYYVGKLIKVLPSSFVDAAKAFRVLFKALKDRDYSLMAAKAIRKLQGSSVNFPVSEVVEMALAVSYKEERAALVKEILKVISKVDSSELKLELFTSAVAPWILSEVEQKVLSHHKVGEAMTQVLTSLK